MSAAREGLHRAVVWKRLYLSPSAASLSSVGLGIPPPNIAGFFTLATGQVDFSDLPTDLARHLPRRTLPVAILAWLGVSKTHQRQGLGRLLLAQALLDCHEAGKTFAFIAV